MKRILIVMAVILLWMMPVQADAAELLDKYIESYGEIFEDKTEGLIPEFNAKEILKELNSGDVSITPKVVLEYISDVLLGEIKSNVKLLAVVFILSLLCSYLSALKEGFGSDAIAGCAFYSCYIIIAGVAATAFFDTAEAASEAVGNIAFFMRFVVPVIISALLMSGAPVSAAALEPTLLAIIEIAVWIIETVFIPAVLVCTALNIVNGMSEKFKTDRLVKLIGSTVKWGLTLTLTIFVSLAGIKSIASSGVDGLTLKLGKFATSNLIPMVGGILAESVETVMSCSMLIKNSVGLLGIICVILIALGPVLKIGAILLIFRISAAIVEPISDGKIVACLSGLADSASVLFSMLSAVTVMFIMVLTILINAGGM